MSTVERAWDGTIAIVPVHVLANAKLSREARLLYAMACGMIRYPGDKEVARMLGVRASSLTKFWDELVEAGLAQLVEPLVVHDASVRSYVITGTFWDVAEGDAAVAVPVANVVRPARRAVDRMPVTDAEEALARDVLDYFNQVAETGYTLNQDHLRMLVMRIRSYPDVTIDEHRKIVDAFFSGEKWWNGRPSLNLIYGNDGQFERCRERAHGGTGRGGSLSAQDMLRAARSSLLNQEARASVALDGETQSYPPTLRAIEGGQ